jgi:phosphoglycerate kinase
VSSTVGDSARTTVAGLAYGEIALLENVRFKEKRVLRLDARIGEMRRLLKALANRFPSI